MSSEIDLTLILRNTANASSDAEAAFAATERLVVAVGARFDGIEALLAAMEGRFNALERRVGSVGSGMDAIARSNHRIEQMLSDAAARIGAVG